MPSADTRIWIWVDLSRLTGVAATRPPLHDAISVSDENEAAVTVPDQVSESHAVGESHDVGESLDFTAFVGVV
jgi:hypothetical protein